MKRFIVGTDTDVGKTHYGKLLMGEGNHVIKPIETGRLAFDDIWDSDSYGYALGQDLTIDAINLYFFDEPVSPHFASQIDNRPIEIEALKRFVESADERLGVNQDLLIELAGGLMVPFFGQYTQLDFIQSFQDAAVDLVIANKLGCINHSLMTMKLLTEAGVSIHTVVINNLNKKSTSIMENNIKTIKMWLDDQSILRII